MLTNKFCNIFRKNKEYISCPSINSRLCLNKFYLTYCNGGNVNNYRKCPVIQDHNKVCIDVNELIKTMKNDKNKIRQGSMIESCINCRELKLADWDEMIQKDQLLYLDLACWNLCNSKCIYCKDSTDQKTLMDTMPILPVIEQLIKKKLITKDTEISITGGEPTLYFQFEDIMDLLIKFGIKKMRVCSNAMIYSETIEKGISSGILDLFISIDAGSKQIHQKIKGVNSYDTVLKNLEKYAKALDKNKPNHVYSKYIIIPGINDNIEEMEQWINKSRSIGVRHFFLDSDYNIFRAGGCSKDTVEKLNLLAEYFETKMKEYEYHFCLYPSGLPNIL